MGLSIKPIGSNQTELFIPGVATVLFSYETPVAYIKEGKYHVTTEKFSVTTSKHINQWVNGSERVPVLQSDIEALLS